MADADDPLFILATGAAAAATSSVKPFLVKAAAIAEGRGQGIIRIMFCSIGGLMFLMHDMLTMSGMEDLKATDFMFDKLRKAHDAGVRGARKADKDFDKMVNVPTERGN